MSDESVKKKDITDSRDQPAMKARVVAPKAGVTVDGDDSRNDLRGEKYEKGNVEGGFGDFKSFVLK